MPLRRAWPEQHIDASSRAWPSGFAALPDPPVRLRIRGQLPELAGAIAVVGTRYADDDALEFAFDLGRDLAAAGRTVVSGGALGIDAAAHRGALDAGGATVAVLATGFDPAYPPSHRDLFGEIATAGALVSEADDGSPRSGWTFLARNRLIAALGTAVVVVQAPARSGALSTARLALGLNKPVFTVPYAPWQVRGEGCIALLRQGVAICTSVGDVLSVRAQRGRGVPQAIPDRGERSTDSDELDGETRRVLRALGRTPTHPDKLAMALGLPIIRVQQVLLQLLLTGQAAERGHGGYIRTTKPRPR